MKKNNLIKITEYLLYKKDKNNNSKNEVTIKEIEENVKIYYVKHSVE